MNKLLPLVISLLLTSCVPAMICAGGGALGAVAIRNRTGISGTLRDNAIHANILSSLSKVSLFKNIEVSVKHSRVLLLGYVENQEQKMKAIELASKAKGVTEVIDGIKIGYRTTLEHSMTDTAITSRIKSAMAVDGNVHCLNFNITTYDNVVYILGTAENELERDIVINIARSTSYVNKVVSYINIVNNNK